MGSPYLYPIVHSIATFLIHVSSVQIVNAYLEQIPLSKQAEMAFFEFQLIFMQRLIHFITLLGSWHLQSLHGEHKSLGEVLVVPLSISSSAIKKRRVLTLCDLRSLQWVQVPHFFPNTPFKLAKALLALFSAGVRGSFIASSRVTIGASGEFCLLSSDCSGFPCAEGDIALVRLSVGDTMLSVIDIS